MQNLFAVELLFVTLIFLVGKGHSLKCYQCRSDTDDGCSSSMNETWSKECQPKQNGSKVYCRKIHQKLKFKDEKGWTSIRECAYEKQRSSCYRAKWLELVEQETCECGSENCNSGRSRIPDILTIVLVFALTRIFSYYLKTNNTWDSG